MNSRKWPELDDLEVTIEASLYHDLLSAGLYPTIAAAMWEAFKNGWDSIVRLIRRQGTPVGYRGKVQLLSFPGAFETTLICLDNGQGITEEEQSRFCRVGPDELGTATGKTGKKKIGRFAPFSFLKNPKAGFIVLTATSADGPVTLFTITPELLASGRIPRQLISRTDSNMYGLRPTGTFAMVVMPNVVEKATRFADLEKELQWMLPRRESPEGFELYLGNKQVQAPPLADEFQREAGGISGYFEKVVSTTNSGSRNERGIWLCDAETNTRVAYCPEMTGTSGVPSPITRPEIRGDIFIPDLLGHQDTSRARLKAEFLGSREWRTIAEQLYRTFHSELMDLLGDEGVFTKDLASQASLDAIRAMKAVWGNPAGRIKPPAGISPESDVIEELSGGQTDGSDKNKVFGTGQPPKRDVRPRQRPFCYRDRTFFLTLSSSPRPDVPAEIDSTGKVVFFNTRNPLLEVYKRSQPALTAYIVRAIITAIELGNEDLQLNAKELERLVEVAMQEFYAKQAK